MRNDFWYMFVNIKRSERYYWHYKAMSTKIDLIIKACVCIASCGSVASMGIWRNLWWLWGAIVFVAQIIGATQHLLPFSNQVVSISYLLPDLTKLINEIRRDWYRIDDFTDEIIVNKIAEYYGRFDDLESKYLGNTYFPVSKSCDKTADKDLSHFTNDFFSRAEEIEVTI